jgi:hypothetical protein
LAIRSSSASSLECFGISEPKEYDFHPYNIPPEYLQTIGLAIACSAQTESIVEMAIAGCLGVDFEYGLATTMHMAMPLRFSVLKSVAEIRIDNLDDLDELDRLINAVEDAFDKRNALAHRQWGTDPETGEVFTIKQQARSRLEMDLLPMSIDQVKADALFIYMAGMKLTTFLSRRGLLPPFPPKPRPRHHKSKAARKKRRESLGKK